MLKFQIQRLCVRSILHVQFRSKIDSRKLSLCRIGSYLREITFWTQISVFREIGMITGSVESKQKAFRQSWS